MSGVSGMSGPRVSRGFRKQTLKCVGVCGVWERTRRQWVRRAILIQLEGRPKKLSGRAASVPPSNTGDPHGR